jgi:putative transcription factor
LQCEVCGRTIVGKPYKAIIEGARLVVCSECAALGSLSWEVKSTLKQGKPTMKARRPRKPQLGVSTQRQSPSELTLELVQDFGTRIRQSREALGLSHEDLGRRINEKVSVLKKLEGQKMRPNNRLAEKLQHALKIELLVPATEEKLPKGLLTTAPPSKGITLGDLVRRREKQAEETR